MDKCPGKFNGKAWFFDFLQKKKKKFRNTKKVVLFKFNPLNKKKSIDQTKFKLNCCGHQSNPGKTTKKRAGAQKSSSFS